MVDITMYVLISSNILMMAKKIWIIALSTDHCADDVNGVRPSQVIAARHVRDQPWLMVGNYFVPQRRGSGVQTFEKVSDADVFAAVRHFTFLN